MNILLKNKPDLKILNDIMDKYTIIKAGSFQKSICVEKIPY